MKVKEKDLVIGDQYIIGTANKETAVFVGIFPSEDNENDKACFFYKTGKTSFLRDSDGTIGFWINPSMETEYEEV